MITSPTDVYAHGYVYHLPIEQYAIFLLLISTIIIIIKWLILHYVAALHR